MLIDCSRYMHNQAEECMVALAKVHLQGFEIIPTQFKLKTSHDLALGRTYTKADWCIMCGVYLLWSKAFCSVCNPAALSGRYYNFCLNMSLTMYITEFRTCQGICHICVCKTAKKDCAQCEKV